MKHTTGLFNGVVHANRDRGPQLRDEDRIVRGDLKTVGRDKDFALSRHLMLYTATSHAGGLPGA